MPCGLSSAWRWVWAHGCAASSSEPISPELGAALRDSAKLAGVINDINRYRLATIGYRDTRQLYRLVQSVLMAAQVAHLDQRTGQVEPVRPRLFIMYAHENPAHKEQVLAFAKFLRGVCGFDTRIDCWARPVRQHWGRRTVREITQADFVLVMASPQCKAVGDGQVTSGVNRGLQAEFAVLLDLLSEDRELWTRKILPTVLPGGSVRDIPLSLCPRNVDHYLIESVTVSGSESLIRAITGLPRYQRPAAAREVIRLSVETPVAE